MVIFQRLINLKDYRGFSLAVKTKKIGKAAADQWHVRDENGGVFGPVDFSALKSWVKDGRVSPASEVSADGERWVLAVSVPEFEMNCVAEIEPGSFYGPIHRSAMRGLIAAGSISAEAVVYCKNLESEKAERPPSLVGVSQEEHAAALDKLTGIETEKRAVEAKLQSVSSELAALIVSYESEKRGGSELTGVVEGLRQEVERVKGDGEEYQSLIKLLQGEGDEQKTQIKLLQSAGDDYRAQITSLQGEGDEQKAQIKLLQNEGDDYRAQITSLQGEGGEQKAQIKLLQSEGDDSKALINSLQGEVEAYKRELVESRSVSDEVTLKYQSEIFALNELNGGLKVQIGGVNAELDDFKVEIEALRKSNRDQLKLLEDRDRLYEAELKERESSCSLKIDNVILEHESAINRIKHQSIEEIHSLQESNTNLQGGVKSLNKEIKYLQDGNLVLKEEFVQYEKLKSRSGSNDAAQRKLIVLKNLFAEAAMLLEGVEREREDVPQSSFNESPAEVLEPELLDYEEVMPDEVETEKRAPAVVAEPVKKKINRKSTAKQGEAPKPKGEKKWPFGRGKKSVGHDSLAELEAQAQIELQRLSSSQGISAIFDKKK